MKLAPEANPVTDRNNYHLALVLPPNLRESIQLTQNLLTPQPHAALPLASTLRSLKLPVLPLHCSQISKAISKPNQIHRTSPPPRALLLTSSPWGANLTVPQWRTKSTALLHRTSPPRALLLTSSPRRAKLAIPQWSLPHPTSPPRALLLTSSPRGGKLTIP